MLTDVTRVTLPQLATGIVNTWAVHRGEWSNEVYRMKFKMKPSIHDEMWARMTISERLNYWWTRQREADNVAKVRHGARTPITV